MTERNRYPWQRRVVTKQMQEHLASESDLRGQWGLAGREAGPIKTSTNERRHKEKWFKVADAQEVAAYIGDFSADVQIHKTSDCRIGAEIDESDYSLWAFPCKLDTCKQDYVTDYGKPTRLFFPSLDRPPCLLCEEKVLAFLNYSSNRWEVEDAGRPFASTVAIALETIPAYTGGNCFPCGNFQIMLRQDDGNCNPFNNCFQLGLHPCTGLPWIEEMCNLGDEIQSGETVVAFSDLCCQWWIKYCCPEPPGACPDCEEVCASTYTVKLPTLSGCPMACLSGAELDLLLNVGCEYTGSTCVENCLAPIYAGDPVLGCLDNSNVCECFGENKQVFPPATCDTNQPPDCCLPPNPPDPNCEWCQLLGLPSEVRDCTWCQVDCNHGLKDFSGLLRCINDQWILELNGGTPGICPNIGWTFTADPRPAAGACPPLDANWTGTWSLLQECEGSRLRCDPLTFPAAVELLP